MRTGHRRFVRLCDIGDGIAHPRFERFNGSVPHALGFFAAVAKRYKQSFAFDRKLRNPLAHDVERGLFGLPLRGVMRAQFLRNGGGALTDRGEGLLFRQGKIGAEPIAYLAKLGEAFFRCSAQRGHLLVEEFESVADPLADTCHMVFARLAELVEAMKTGHQRFDLAGSGVTRSADLVGHVARSIGNHGKLVAQALHICESSGAHRADRIDLGMVVVDQRLNTVGIGGQTFRSNAAERFKIARLRSDEVPGKRQLAIDHAQPPFQLRRFKRQSASGIGEAICLTPAVAHGEQPQADDEDHGYRPCADPFDP